MTTGGVVTHAVHEATIETTYDERTARVVFSSLEQEAAGLVDDRSRTQVDRVGSRLTIRIEAADLVALRAAVNTWLGLLSVAEETASLVDHGF